ncbi:hypothetical protein [Kitasatospora griseola]|uniref:hypothetical protein n=1 Tax=Kitasatospora griseola TaxID=2064 RepID=UPI00380C4547
MDLRERLDDWTDWDGAAFELGRVLGIFAQPVTFPQVKRVFWTDSPLGNALHEMLLQLVAAGVLERRDEPDDEQFRWSGHGLVGGFHGSDAGAAARGPASVVAAVRAAAAARVAGTE